MEALTDKVRVGAGLSITCCRRCAASAQRALLAGCCFLLLGLVLLVARFLMWAGLHTT